MNYCQFRNDFIKRMANAGGGIIPAEYQQVEYLQSSGTQYIDTGINASSTLQTTLIFRLSQNFDFTKDYFLLGARTKNNSSTRYSVDTPSYTQIRFSNTTTISVANMATSLNTLIYRSGYQEYNGAQVSTASAPATTQVKLWLFGTSNYDNGYTTPYLCNGAQINRCMLGTAADAAVYRDLISCYRKSDNKPGMFDVVTNTFFTNAGTGEFIVGNDI